MAKHDNWFLDHILQNPEKIFSSKNKTAVELIKTATIVFDTNALLVPYDVSKENFPAINKLLQKLKTEKRLKIPARVAREFGKNRMVKMNSLFGKLRGIKNKLDGQNFNIENYPVLKEFKEYNSLTANFKNIRKLIDQSKKTINVLEDNILNWTAEDKVSNAYRRIFTKNVIVECVKEEDEIFKELSLRKKLNIPPGYKDSSKDDDGIGDLVIWHTILQIGRDSNTDVIFVTNEEKSDWFHKQDKQTIFPRFELIEEFRNVSNGKSFTAISFVEFLKLSFVKQEVIDEVINEWNDSIVMQHNYQNFGFYDTNSPYLNMFSTNLGNNYWGSLKTSSGLLGSSMWKYNKQHLHQFNVGDRIHHQLYGLGDVLIDGSINYDSGYKTLGDGTETLLIGAIDNNIIKDGEKK